MNAPFWLILTLLFILGEAFFSMQEMAILSCSRLDLNYRLQRGDRRAGKVRYFLLHPHRLFTTILIFNDACLHIGSECSRRLYAALDWPSLIAPLTQVFFVIILAEMAPMFAARRHPESAARWGVGLLYPLSRLIAPLNWFIGKLSDMVGYCFGIPPSDVERNLLSREDLQALLLPLQDDQVQEDKSLVDLAISNLFANRLSTADMVMQPLSNSPMVPWNTSMDRARRMWLKSNATHLLVYQHSHRQIIGILNSHQLAAVDHHRTAGSCAQLPFFTSAKTPAIKVMQQLRQGEGQVTVVLSDEGFAIGTLDRRLFFSRLLLDGEKVRELPTSRVLEKSFSAQISVGELAQQLKVALPLASQDQSLAQLMEEQLGHLPAKGDICRLNGLEFCVESDSLAGAKLINVRSLIY